MFFACLTTFPHPGRYPIMSFRRVSTTLRQALTEFSELFHVTGTGLLIQTLMGSWGGFGVPVMKRPGGRW
jgi:hypothetical protein